MLIWVGNDDGSEVSSSKSFISKNIFADTIEYVNQEENDNSWYETPKDTVGVLLDATTGENSTDKNKTALFYYLKGSENINKKE